MYLPSGMKDKEGTERNRQEVCGKYQEKIRGIYRKQVKIFGNAGGIV